MSTGMLQFLQEKAGLPESFISAMFENSLERYSPQLWFKACFDAGSQGAESSACSGVSSFPPLDPKFMPAVNLFHGSHDLCVSPSSSLRFAAVLDAAGVPAVARVFEGEASYNIGFVFLMLVELLRS